jgi:hypothetical protein
MGVISCYAIEKKAGRGREDLNLRPLVPNQIPHHIEQDLDPHDG